MPAPAVADMMIYLAWSMDGRGAQEGRTALPAPGGGTRVGEKLTELPLTLYSDPAAAGLQCSPFVAASNSSERCRCLNSRSAAKIDIVAKPAQTVDDLCASGACAVVVQPWAHYCVGDAGRLCSLVIALRVSIDERSQNCEPVHRQSPLGA